MDRAYKSGAVASPPAATDNTSVGYPTAGNPQTGEMPTKPGPYWFHMMTEELVNVLAAAGITPDKATTNQLLTALQTLFVHVSGDTMIGPLTVPQLTSTGLLTGDTLTYTRSASISEADLNTLTTSGFYDGSQLLNAPGGSTEWWYVIVQRHSNADSHCLQIAHGLAGSARDQSWMRAKVSGTWGAWYKLWHANNDGAGSGLDADLLDGMQPATAATASTIAQRGTTGALAVANATAPDLAIALGQLAGSFAANGYLKIPVWDPGAGVMRTFIVQWGITSTGVNVAGDYTQAFTFPVAFASEPLAILGYVKAATGANADISAITCRGIVSQSATGCTLGYDERSSVVQNALLGYFTIGI